jgi:hypothetical protein
MVRKGLFQSFNFSQASIFLIDSGLPWSIGTNVGNILAPALYSSGKVRHMHPIQLLKLVEQFPYLLLFQ